MKSELHFNTIVRNTLVLTLLWPTLGWSAVARPARVFLDAGHGGKDLGAQGFFAVSEKLLSLKLALKVERLLVQKAKAASLPLEVEMSRREDTFLSLRQRVDLANEWDADWFVSLHANSSPARKARGFEVYFASSESSDEAARQLVRAENETPEAEPVKNQVLRILSDSQANYHVAESSRFAESLFRRMAKTLRPNVHGVRQGPFTVISGTQMPAILIEAGYVTHVDDALLFTKEPYLWKVADAISSGIIEFIRNKQKLS